jgi:hypothetical protein
MECDSKKETQWFTDKHCLYSFGKSAISSVPDVIVLVVFFSPLFHDIDVCLNLRYIDYPTQVRAEFLN